MRVVLSGYFGFGNLGDEAVLAAMLAALRPRMPGAEFVALSADPRATADQHGVASVSRLGGAALRAMSGAGLFISGGGSLIQDATSLRSPLYYLSVLAAGRLLARRSMIYAQGIGPIRRPWLRALTGRVGNRVDVVTVRDEESRRLLEACGVRPIELVADPVFALPAASPERAAELLGPPGRARIGAVLRPWADSAYVWPLLEALRRFADSRGAEVVVLVFHPAKDHALSAQAADRIGARLIGGISPQEMMAVIAALDLVVAARLHALIAAAAAGVNLVGIAYDPKVSALLDRVGAGSLLPVAELAPSAAEAVLQSAWAARDRAHAALSARREDLRRAALRSADLAAALAGFPSKTTE